MVGHEGFEWIGFVRPNDLCETYKIRVTYTLGHCPDVEVIEPKLVPRDGCDNIPHMFDQERLCLFRARNKYWNAGMLISETIIHWARLWLYYYEIWHATGEWKGGGEHITGREFETARRRKNKTKLRPSRTGG